MRPRRIGAALNFCFCIHRAANHIDGDAANFGESGGLRTGNFLRFSCYGRRRNRRGLHQITATAQRNQ